MARIVKAHHIGITVRSLSVSLSFYRDILGFEEIFAWNPQAPYIGELVGYPNVDLHAAILRQPGTDVALELLEYRNVDRKDFDSGNANPGILHISFYVEDLDELYRELSEKGIASLSHPVTPTIGPNQGGRAVYMIDPDGVRVEFIQSANSFEAYKGDE